LEDDELCAGGAPCCWEEEEAWNKERVLERRLPSLLTKGAIVVVTKAPTRQHKIKAERTHADKWNIFIMLLVWLQHQNRDYK